MAHTQTRYESTKEFKPVWDAQPVGTIAWMVKIFNGDTGNCEGREYTFDSNDLEDMEAVSDGYFYETYKLRKS